MKRKRYIDKRLDWRDPNMPMLRIAKPDNNPNAEWGVYEFPSDAIHKYHQRAMDGIKVEPMWRDDPSYWWCNAAKKNNLK